MRILSLIYVLAVSLPVFAEAPELRNVMPNSWKKLERLSAKEEAAFLQDNNSIVKQIRDYYISSESYFYSDPDPITMELNLKFVRVYGEAAGADTFYRIVLTDKSEPNFLSREINFFQGLVGIHYGKNTLLFMGSYRVDNTTQFGSNEIYNSIDIVVSKGRAKGILTTYLEVGDLRGLDGSNRNGANYCEYRLLEELPLVIEFEQGSRAFILDMEVSLINGSSCLIDSKSSLRYSLGSAFDGDPATSYVENTKDDLLEIYFDSVSYRAVKKVAIINGYAQDMSLYKKNNRVRSIGIKTVEWDGAIDYFSSVLKEEKLLQDDRLSYQTFDIVSRAKISESHDALFYRLFYVVSPITISVMNVYRGSTYKDTCIAELNIKTEEGWLFGDIDE